MDVFQIPIYFRYKIMTASTDDEVVMAVHYEITQSFPDIFKGTIDFGEENNKKAIYHTKEDVIPRLPNFREELTRIAAKYPNARIKAFALNETPDYPNQDLTFEHGEADVRCDRRVRHDAFDSETFDAAVRILREKGFAEASDCLLTSIYEL